MAAPSGSSGTASGAMSTIARRSNAATASGQWLPAWPETARTAVLDRRPGPSARLRLEVDAREPALRSERDPEGEGDDDGEQQQDHRRAAEEPRLGIESERKALLHQEEKRVRHDRQHPEVTRQDDAQ